jgi:hypothetical protein
MVYINKLPEGGLLAFSGKSINHALAQFEALRVRTKLNDFSNLFTRVAIRLHDQAARDDEKRIERGTIQFETHRSKRSVGIPCGATISLVPRTRELPRLVARITVGAIGDSRRALR